MDDWSQNVAQAALQQAQGTIALMLRRLLLTVCLLLTSCVLTLAVGAQEPPGNTITVTPAFQELSLEEGQISNQYDLSVANTTSAEIEFQVSAADLGGLDETGGQFFAGNEGADFDKLSVVDWLDLSVETLRLKPGETRVVAVTVDNRADLSPGGHYAAIVLQARKVLDQDQTSAQVSIQQRISSLLFVTKRGGEQYDLALKSLNHNGSLLQLPQEARVTFQNPGNTHITPRGIAYLKNSAGEVLSSGVINLESGMILPGATRTYNLQLVSRKSGWSWAPAGYRLEVEYRYDGLEQTAREHVGIRYIHPLPLVLGVGVIGLLAYKYRRQRRYKKSYNNSVRSKKS